MRSVSGSLILVVEPAQDLRVQMCQFLEQKGYAVCEAVDGREAIEVFDRTSPKMVLMNAELPTISGIDACRRIRQIDRDEYSPVLMFTSQEDDGEFITAVFAAGAADYIKIPIQWDALEHRIKYKLQASRALYELVDSEQRFRQLFEDSPLPYQSLDDHGRIVDVNAAWLEMMKLQADDVLGKPLGDFMKADEWRKFMCQFPLFIKTGVLSNLHLHVIDGENKGLDIELNGRVAYDLDGRFKQTHSVMQNITERKAMEDELKRLATTDPLTGLANRRSFNADAESLRRLCMRYTHPYSTMMLDIDHFKAINDSFGHDVGDEVLKEVADVMRQELRDVDVLGRLGGEEFAVILPETPKSEAVKVAERIRKAIEAFAMDTEQGRITFTMSIGVTTLTQAQESNEQLLKDADALLYQAKQSGRNRVEY